MDSEGSGPEEPCDMEPVEGAGPEKPAKSDVEKSEEPDECVLSAAVVPCLEPLASRPLSLGTRDEDLVKYGADITESEEPANGIHFSKFIFPRAEI
ncbi:Hypothetical predicted protein [Octopus vulgaris]|uniref:Uncharacterized protein n=1 Tax=Octopus vulgaris TaxID=6645 RepID=A0AA36B0V6_OCTVU|nr:Hypothetical predicted protein [Octopus vulgaris]